MAKIYLLLRRILNEGLLANLPLLVSSGLRAYFVLILAGEESLVDPVYPNGCFVGS